MIRSDKRMFQLTRQSVGRTRTIRDGALIVEETVPALASETMISPTGNEHHVPMMPGRVPDENGRRYMQQHRERLIKDGWLPRRECPLTSKYEDLVGGPLVVSKAKGDKPCTSVDPATGCHHYREAGAARRAWHKENSDKIVNSMTNPQALLNQVLASSLASGRLTINALADAGKDD